MSPPPGRSPFPSIGIARGDEAVEPAWLLASLQRVHETPIAAVEQHAVLGATTGAAKRLERPSVGSRPRPEDGLDAQPSHRNRLSAGPAGGRGSRVNSHALPSDEIRGERAALRPRVEAVPMSRRRTPLRLFGAGSQVSTVGDTRTRELITVEDGSIRYGRREQAEPDWHRFRGAMSPADRDGPGGADRGQSHVEDPEQVLLQLPPHQALPRSLHAPALRVLQ